jgi:hypothetical protein
LRRLPLRIQLFLKLVELHLELRALAFRIERRIDGRVRARVMSTTLRRRGAISLASSIAPGGARGLPSGNFHMIYVALPVAWNAIIEAKECKRLHGGQVLVLRRMR